MNEQDIIDMQWAGIQVWEMEEILVQGYHITRDSASALIHKALKF